jgi:short-subunit dehydrogenase
VLQLAKSGFNIKLVARNVEMMEKVAQEAKAINPDIKTEIVSLNLADSTP